MGKTLRVLNLAAFLFNLAGIILIRWVVPGKSGHDILEKYVSFFSPSDWIFWLWIPVYILEGIWAISQLWKSIVPTIFITHITSIWFFVGSCLQVLWLFLFRREMFTWATVALTLNFVAFFAIVYNLTCLKTKCYRGSPNNLIRFPLCAVGIIPFVLHYAISFISWLTSLNLIAAAHVSRKSSYMMISVNLFTFGFLLSMILFHSLSKRFTLPPIPLFMGLASFAAYGRLKNMHTVFHINENTLAGIRSSYLALGWLGVTLMIIPMARNFYWYFVKGPEIRGGNWNDLEDVWAPLTKDSVVVSVPFEGDDFSNTRLTSLGSSTNQKNINLNYT